MFLQFKDEIKCSLCLNKYHAIRPNPLLHTFILVETYGYVDGV